MTRGIPIILFALFIDGLQAGISAGIIGAGAAVGWIPILGQAVGMAGFAFALVINMCLSLGLGSALVLLTIAQGYHPWRLFPAFIEVMPGLNMFPAWTVAALWVVWKKEGEEKTESLIQKVFSTTSEEKAVRLRQSAAEVRTQRADRQTPREIPAPAEAESVREEKEQAQKPIRIARNLITDIRPAKTLAIVALFFFSAHSLYAQTIDPVQFVISPEVPGPNETVSIEVRGVGSFLGESNLTWRKDGELVLQGVGERRYSFTTGGIGVPTRIQVTISSQTHGAISREFSFIPAAVHLVWEADTSVPPLYRGKALYSAGSRIKIIAFPVVVANGSTLSSNNLSFRWTRNGEPLPSVSGLGRDTLNFVGEQLRSSETIGVEIYFGSAKVAQAQTLIRAVEPQIVFYSRDPLRGVLYDRALPANIYLSSNEITLQAVPYFFSNESLQSSAVYRWRLNNQEVTGPDSSRGILTLRQSGSGAGQAVLVAELQNTDPSKFLQRAQSTLQIVFGAQSSSAPSLFGI